MKIYIKRDKGSQGEVMEIQKLITAKVLKSREGEAGVDEYYSEQGKAVRVLNKANRGLSGSYPGGSEEAVKKRLRQEAAEAGARLQELEGCWSDVERLIRKNSELQGEILELCHNLSEDYAIVEAGQGGY